MKVVHRTLWGALRSRHEPESLHIFANVFWRLLIASSVAIAVFVVAYNAWVYVDVNKALSGSAAVAAPDAAEKQPFDRQKLKAIVGGIEARKELFLLYSEQPLVATDPSQNSAAKPSENPKK